MLISIVIILVLCALPKSIAIIGDRGLISIITNLIQILVGFYIASLAAVATFQKDGLDDLLAGDPVTLNVNRQGKYKEIPLTRRKFLCFLFGYLSFMGIILYFTGAVAELLSENIKILAPAYISLVVVKCVFLFLYLLATSHLFVTTLLGLHYMTDRMHRK